MKQIKTTDIGGFPVVLNDIRWIEAGVIESIRAICRSLLPSGTTNMVLNGCHVTALGDNVYSVAQGWVYLAIEGREEICQVDAHTYTHDGAPGDIAPRWTYQLTYDTTGNKIFNNGQTKQTYLMVKAKIVVTDDDSLPLATSVLPLASDWIHPVMVSPFTSTQNRAVQYRRKFNSIEFRGAIDGVSGLALNLPPGFRPTSPFEQVVQIMPVESATCMKKVYINTTGSVSIITNEAIQTTIPMCFSVPL